jgi:hypothetical protein
MLRKHYRFWLTPQQPESAEADEDPPASVGSRVFVGGLSVVRPSPVNSAPMAGPFKKAAVEPAPLAPPPVPTNSRRQSRLATCAHTLPPRRHRSTPHVFRCNPCTTLGRPNRSMCLCRAAGFRGGRRRLVAVRGSQRTGADGGTPVGHPQWPLATRPADEQSTSETCSGRLSTHGNELGESASDWQPSKERRPWPAHCWQAPKSVVPPSQAARHT